MHPPNTATIIKSSSSSLPPDSELLPLFSTVKRYPLHLTQHSQFVDFDGILNLSCLTDDLPSQITRNNVLIGKTYLHDPSIFEASVPVRSARDCVTARNITPEQADQLFEYGIVEEVEDETEVKGRSLCFPVPEPHKGRERFIQHTLDANESLPPAPGVKFRTVKELCDLVHKGDFMIEIDLKSYYHQFRLSREVANYFCFRLPTREGRTRLVRLLVAPTGFSHMVFTGCAVTDRLLDFDHANSTVDTHIDNIAIISPTADEAISQISTLVKRCDASGVTIKEDTSNIAKLVTRKTTYCGIVFDLKNKTVAVPEKTLDKVKLSLSLIDGWSHRGFAAMLGLLNYGTQILEVPLAEYFNLWRFVGEVGRKMHASDHKEWDTPISIPAAAMKDLQAWITVILANVPRKVPPPFSPNLLMTVDSCAEGWGYIALDETTGEMWHHRGSWSNAFRRKYGHLLKRSVFTEPWGVYFAKSHVMSKISGSRNFLIGTDNVATAATFRRRYCARSYHLNVIAKLDYNTFPQLQTKYIHVAGRKNSVADFLSRNASSNVVNDEIRGYTPESLRRLLGVQTLVDSTP